MELFIAFAREAELHLCEFNGQSIANTAWAFAKLGQLDTKLFAALAGEANLRIREFNVQSVANTAWAFPKLGQLDVKLFAALAEKRACGFASSIAKASPTRPGPSRS